MTSSFSSSFPSKLRSTCDLCSSLVSGPYRKRHAQPAHGGDRSGSMKFRILLLASFLVLLLVFSDHRFDSREHFEAFYAVERWISIWLPNSTCVCLTSKLLPRETLVKKGNLKSFNERERVTDSPKAPERRGQIAKRRQGKVFFHQRARVGGGGVWVVRKWKLFQEIIANRKQQSEGREWKRKREISSQTWNFPAW